MHDQADGRLVGYVEPSIEIAGGFDAFAPWNGEHLGIFPARELAGEFLHARERCAGFATIQGEGAL